MGKGRQKNSEEKDYNQSSKINIAINKETKVPKRTSILINSHNPNVPTMLLPVNSPTALWNKRKQCHWRAHYIPPYCHSTLSWSYSRDLTLYDPVRGKDRQRYNWPSISKVGLDTMSLLLLKEYWPCWREGKQGAQQHKVWGLGTAVGKS